MFKFFVIGGVHWMTILTIILLALLLAAWKAPAWVKEIGMIALAVGVLAFLVGFHKAAIDITKAGEIAPRVIWGGLSVAVITPTYGLIIYFVSLVIRIVQKPRI